MNNIPAPACPICGAAIEAVAVVSETAQCPGCFETLSRSDDGQWVARVDGWIRLEMGANDPLLQSLLVLFDQLRANPRLKFLIRLGLEQALVDTLKQRDFGDTQQPARLSCVISTGDVCIAVGGSRRRFER